MDEQYATEAYAERFAKALPQILPTFERPPKPTPLENERVREDRYDGDANPLWVVAAIVGVVVVLACMVAMIAGGN